MGYVKLGVDETAVSRLLAGDTTGARLPDYWEAIRILVARGYHDGQIAYLLRRQRRSVMRTRNALGIPPVISRHAGTIAELDIVPAPTRPRNMR